MGLVNRSIAAFAVLLYVVLPMLSTFAEREAVGVDPSHYRSSTLQSVPENNILPPTFAPTTVPTLSHQGMKELNRRNLRNRTGSRVVFDGYTTNDLIRQN